MKTPSLPLTRDLVLVGGGHAHALLLRMWGMKPMAGVRLTLINPGPTAAYSGMLPGFVAGHYGREELDIDLVRLARFAGARMVFGAAEALDPVAKQVHVPGRPPVAYDICSVDVGIESKMPELAGFAGHGIPVKPLTPFAGRWNEFRAGSGPARVAVIGGGVAGSELSMAMAHALRHREAEVRLVDAGRALTELGDTAREKVRAALSELDVELLEQAPVERVEAEALVLRDGRRLASDFTVGAAGATPFGWLAQSGLDLHDGFVRVDARLRSSDPSVFAAGDCAHLSSDPRPKAGVYAVRAAPVLFDNLRAALSGRELRSWRPQRRYLKLVSLGGRSALAEKGGVSARGPLLWRWKDRIDRRFMQKLDELPAMESAEIPRTAAEGIAEALGDKPMCGGCGAKVGRGALGAALADVPHWREDVESLPGDDAAVLRTGRARQVMTTDHLRSMVEDPVVMTRIAANHALGDIWAMGAAPQAATTTVILPRMSADLQQRTLSELMSAASEVMQAAGAEIVGGHSSMGEETTLGFTVTGLCESEPITLAGARPGDRLILTKPLGSGTILAAEMQLKARGAEVEACLAEMQRPQAEASRLLSGAHAMTDVTGFGLAGHLMGICEASGVSAELEVAAVPLMEGAEALADAGVRSTIWGENRMLAPEVPQGGRNDLLFDPQTAGGLLAAVPESEAASLLEALSAAGYPAVLIGRITEGPARVKAV